METRIFSTPLHTFIWPSRERAEASLRPDLFGSFCVRTKRTIKKNILFRHHPVASHETFGFQICFSSCDAIDNVVLYPGLRPGLPIFNSYGIFALKYDHEQIMLYGNITMSNKKEDTG